MEVMAAEGWQGLPNHVPPPCLAGTHQPQHGGLNKTPPGHWSRWPSCSSAFSALRHLLPAGRVPGDEMKRKGMHFEFGRSASSGEKGSEGEHSLPPPSFQKPTAS